MSIQTKKRTLFGMLAAAVLSLFGKSPAKPNTDDLKQAEFKTSTQKMGIRFTEKIRNVFRFRWIRKN
ncbi:MAG: hypothetical protein ACYS0I_07220 [Planctomycetota bacterium]|jgi:hypothetical protein